MKGKISVIMLIAGAFFLFNAVSCSKGGSDDTGGTTPPPAGSSCAGTKGPLFTTVETLVNSKCLSCHNKSLSNGGVSFTDYCSIIDHKTRIKVRAVDEGTMPQTGALPQADKDKITAWLNAGGLVTN